jgi:hypothetical protein
MYDLMDVILMRIDMYNLMSFTNINYMILYILLYVSIILILENNLIIVILSLDIDLMNLYLLIVLLYKVIIEIVVFVMLYDNYYNLFYFGLYKMLLYLMEDFAKMVTLCSILASHHIHIDEL